MPTYLPSRVTITLALSLVLCIPTAAQELKSTAIAPLPPEQVIRNLQEHNAQRAAALAGFTGKRTYHLQYRGFGGAREAEMTVSVTYTAPTTKQFTIETEKGSKVLIDRVLKKLLESEKEAAEENQRQIALSPDNYTFSSPSYEESPEGGRYVFTLTPKTENKFLYRGKVWIDARDFAVVRIAAEPARNPSFWVKKTDIAHTYTHQGRFWLPLSNHTESATRFGGHAVLTIEYLDYKVTSSPTVTVALKP
jgi:outer membrane lipoprotein-sorting protein